MARTKRKVNPLVPETTPAQPAEKVYRTVAYARLSIEDSGKPGSDTIESQKRLLMDYIERTTGLECCGMFCDNGRTGTDFNRPEFERLMDEVRQGKIDCIVVKDLSRFGRNYKETGNYLERIFPFLSVRFIAVNDNFDTLTSERNEYGFIVPLKNLMNETYSRNISQKSAAVLHVKQQNGDFIGAWAPYGCRKSAANSHKLEPNPVTAPIVQRMFQLRADGMSYNMIARRFNDEEIPSPAHYLCLAGVCKCEQYANSVWKTMNVKNILAHQAYLGHMVQGVKKQSFHAGQKQTYLPESEWIIVRNTHEPIIDAATFDKVQEMRLARKESYSSTLGKFSQLGGTENALRGLIFCADCKRPLVRYKNVSHGKKLWYTFICQSHSNDPESCPYKNIREDELQELLLPAIRGQIQLATDMESMIKKINSSPTFKGNVSTLKGKLDTALRALKHCETLRDSLYQNYVEHIMTEQEYIAMKRRYTDETASHEARISELEHQQEVSKELTPDNRFLAVFGHYKDAPELTHDMVCALIDRVEVGNDNDVSITFRYRDEYKALSDYLRKER